MAILVTGGAGYIGSHMVLALCDLGHDVVVLDTLATGVRWAVSPQARFVEGDVGDFSLVSPLLREHHIDTIVHFAGSVVVPQSVRDPLGYYGNNTSASRTLLQAAVEANVRHFLFSSTAAVYGTPSSTQVTEDSPLLPLSPYGYSKLMTERMLEDSVQAYGLNGVALRYFNVAGANIDGRAGQSTPGATHLIKLACQVALGQRPYLEIFGTDYPTRDRTGVRDYIHVDDLISAHLCALDWMKAGNNNKMGIFNCGYGHGASVLEVVSAIEDVTGKALPLKKSPRRPGDVAEIIANAQRARDILGWRPRHGSLTTIVKTALDWEKHLEKRNG